MKTLTAAGLGALGLLLAPTPAEACGGPGVAFLHRTLPSLLPAGAIVAEIEFEFDIRIDLRPGVADSLRARVRRMIQGYYSGPALIVRAISTSCESPFGNGVSGYLIGIPKGIENGELVVAPISAPRSPALPPPDALRIPGQEGAGTVRLPL